MAEPKSDSLEVAAGVTERIGIPLVGGGEVGLSVFQPGWRWSNMDDALPRMRGGPGTR